MSSFPKMPIDLLRFFHLTQLLTKIERLTRDKSEVSTVVTKKISDLIRVPKRSSRLLFLKYMKWHNLPTLNIKNPKADVVKIKASAKTPIEKCSRK